MNDQDFQELEKRVSNILQKWGFKRNDSQYIRFYRDYTFTFQLSPIGLSGIFEYKTDTVSCSFSAFLEQHIFPIELLRQEDKFVEKVIKDKLNDFILSCIDKELFNQD